MEVIGIQDSAVSLSLSFGSVEHGVNFEPFVSCPIKEKIDNIRDGWSRKVMARSPHSLNAVATFFRRFWN
jgi:hypothetical protein